MTNESSAGGGGAILRPPDDWNDWVSASAPWNYFQENTLADWLDLYGAAKGFKKDACPNELAKTLDHGRFLKEQGKAFEACVVRHLGGQYELVTIADGGWRDSQSPDKHAETKAALRRGCAIVHSGVLWNFETKTYGMPDFLIRSDVFDALFPGHLAEGEAKQSAEALGGAWHYIVVDAKFTTLKLNALPKAKTKPRKGYPPGEVGSGEHFPAYKAQLFIYNEALARLQGYKPRRAFLLGRGWEQKQEGRDMSGTNALTRLGPVSMGGEPGKLRDAVAWIREVRTDGRNWNVLPSPTRRELRPPSLAVAKRPWKNATRDIAERLDDPIIVSGVGTVKREAAAQRGITSWRKATPEQLGAKEKTASRLQAILDVNRPDGPPVRPARVRVAESEWRQPPALEFFVDFETVEDLNDDFSRFPEKGGQAMIFMIGCGHLEDGEWNFHCFIADRLDLPSEERIITDWLEHMNTVGERLGSPASGAKVFHWTVAETTQFDRAVKRHPQNTWAKPGWFDLCDKVVKAEPFVVRGAFGFGLKEVAKALYDHRRIETSWKDSPVDGKGATVGAWRCDRDAAEKGIRLEETALMQEIREYNQVDCRVMQEILDYLRKNH